MILRTSIATLLTGVMLLGTREARATWPNSPTENVLLASISGYSEAFATCPDSAGGAIVVWEQWTPDCNIFAQHIRSDGSLAWGSGGVLVYGAADNQRDPSVASDGAGGAIVAWCDYRGYDIYAQRVDSLGVTRWTPNGIPVCVAYAGQYDPKVVASDSGAAIITWWDYRNVNDDIYAQRVSAGGQAQWTGDGVPLCTHPSLQQLPVLASDGSGGAIVVWKDARTGGVGLYAQRVGRNGVAMWAVDGIPIADTYTLDYDPVVIAGGSGGAFVAWSGSSDGTYGAFDVWAQRLSSGGNRSWGANGVPVSTATSNQVRPQLAADGAGRVYLTWGDYRSGANLDIYAQCLDSAGASMWTTNGIPVCVQPYDQDQPQIVANRSGGATIAWQDYRRQNWDIYAQGLDGAGRLLWDPNGVAIATLAPYQVLPLMVSDGVDGGIVFWHDTRNNTAATYGQRINRLGRLGGEEAVITGVADAPNDEGGRVIVAWAASCIDTAFGKGIASYTVQRRDSNPNHWSDIASVPATASAFYSVEADGPIAEVDHPVPPAVFSVVAIRQDGLRQWESQPDSGYSIDNLPPASPVVLSASRVDATAKITWAANHEPDISYYRIYGGTTLDFPPSPSRLVAMTVDTTLTFTSSDILVYKLSAVDMHGNEGPTCTAAPGIAGLPPEIGTGAIRLEAIVPNPAHGGCSFRLRLPAEAPVRLEVLDL